MGQKQSRDELLYQQVSHGNSERIKALSREGAGLEWTDKEGKSPLIVACMHPELFHVAKTLIELGANVDAYRRGFHGGTPLHHAAEKGLDQAVKLLLSHGAKALVTNDDCQTPLDVARVKGYNNVVNAIELNLHLQSDASKSHICLFSGWLRELSGPGFLEVLAPGWVWVVVIPCGSHKFKKHLKFELAIYPSSQDAQPRRVIQLSKAKIKKPKFRRADPALIIVDKSTKTRYKLASENEGDKQQIQWLYNACKGISPVLRPLLTNTQNPVVSVTAPPSTAEDVELAMAIDASIQPVVQERPSLLPNTHLSSENINGLETSVDNIIPIGLVPTEGPMSPSKASSSGWLDEPAKDTYNQWGMPKAGPSGNPTQHVQSQHNIPVPASSIPSAPPILEEVVDDGSVPYLPINSSTPTVANRPVRTSEVKENEGAASSCVICLDAQSEGACVPCGHMAGCMSCLNEIKAKNWGCPVCRAKIDQVIRVYAV
ncbi:hypothetical protein HHK36_020483 [Tetracentron sinense]|uniref:RING-type domain-containing protein n=1 Tax=Tetracentron sinense TaxID=13715 RepID=A0A835D8V9_TETSI|nr:hypothetical protein HHK36_020483 [Tetracentron sinense]